MRRSCRWRAPYRRPEPGNRAADCSPTRCCTGGSRREQISGWFYMGTGDAKAHDCVPSGWCDGDPERAAEQPTEPGRFPSLRHDPAKQFRRGAPKDILERSTAKSREKARIVGPRSTKNDIGQRLFRIVVGAGKDVSERCIGLVRPVAATLPMIFGIHVQMPTELLDIGPGNCPVQFVGISFVRHLTGYGRSRSHVNGTAALAIGAECRAGRSGDPTVAAGDQTAGSLAATGGRYRFGPGPIDIKLP